MDDNIFIEIDRASEEFFHKLDEIAPEGISSVDWTGIVFDTMGYFESYDEWVKEVWD